MIAIQVLEDPFQRTSDKLSEGLSSGSDSNGYNHVRRPTRGIVLKDETFATLRVVRGSGDSQLLIDAGGNRKTRIKRLVDGKEQEVEDYMTVGNKRATDIYSNFLLQQVNEERMEKQQILETFGEPYIFLFGERARLMTFQGSLVNTWDFNWEAEWWHNYENYLRGTKCVENDCRVFLSFDETLIGGYIIGSASAKNAQDRNVVNFQFQMFVTTDVNFSRIGNPYMLPDGARSVVLDDVTEWNNRPELMPENGELMREYQIANGAIDLNKTNFMDSVKSSISKISNTFSSVKSLVTSAAINKASSTLNGEVIRVPVGYAGSLMFDDDVSYKNLTLVTDTGEGRALKYSTFSDNIDEYVGKSSHYGSAVTNSGVQKVNIGLNSFQDSISSGKKAAETARKIWEDAGYSFTAEAVTSTLAGMVDVGRSTFQLASGIYAVAPEAAKISGVSVGSSGFTIELDEETPTVEGRINRRSETGNTWSDSE